MSPSLFYISLAVSCACLAILSVGTAESACLVDNTTDGFLLPVVDVPGYGMCPRGYLCPNSNPANVSTYPRICPATTECLALRLDNQFCPPQGTYEPYVCPAGFYCPTGLAALPCPKGYYCPVGTTDPFKCAPISSCPEGTSVTYDYGSLVLIGVLDFFFILAHFYVRRLQALKEARCGPSEEMAEKKALDLDVTEEDHTMTSAWSSLAADDRRKLCLAIENRRSPMQGMTFEFSNLSVTIPAVDNKPEKVVLQSVSGVLRPGQVTAVMGPSGAGKTVFFTALLTKQDPSWKTTGSLRINGEGPEHFERFRHVIGYVPQDDTLHNDITVLDNIWYSSEVRLPRQYTLPERDELRSVAMRGFGVNTLASMTASQLSGSQKKKCSIAVEAACAPAALFLDEPTSALDATAAYDLCKGLTALAQESNMTVVMVIHQPRVEHFERFRHVIGYVPQDDTLHNDITVLDNIWYSSEVRLPRQYTLPERDELRSVAMRGFGVNTLASMTASQLSGSQKKKCSIAVEAACAPAALFLDEPTSALDATAAYDLCKGLTALAQESNMTVVMVIHQPRVEIWNGLDQVLFLAPGGFTVYQGSQKNAVHYFEQNLGFTFGQGNPADIIIDGIAERRDACIEAWDRFLQSDAAAAAAGGSAGASGQSEPHQLRMPSNNTSTMTAMVPAPGCVFPHDDEPATFWRQFVLSHNRSILKQSHYLISVVLDVALCMIAAAIMASAAVQTRYVGILVSPYALISPKHIGYLIAMLGMFYSIAIAATSSVTTLRSFMGERECYWREMATGGHNRVAYYLGTIFAEVYRIFLTALHFTMVAYFMLQPLQSFWQFFLVILLLFVGFDSQASMLSMVIKPSSAPLFVTVAGVFVSLLNGFPTIPILNFFFFIKPSSAPLFVTVAGVFVSLLNGFPTIPILNFGGFTFYLTEALLTQEIGYTNDLYVNVLDQYNTARKVTDYLVAALLIIAYRVIGYVLMRFTNRDKQR
ncbi:ABC transporter, putative [Bodo saltans]|uniref:ABC transporter, putative n=1 Tax=Bodo saltans TaxID=75058 RepID=A0A0S4IRK2_BODSA|nr:ABC transporter, putative [Bodo saltans]|eukprot:CUG02458.1 ABC transporter, putative [Bodo saltans]